MILFLIFLFQRLFAQPATEEYPVYNGTDLGLTYTTNSSQFRIWSPTATEAQLLFYKDGIGGTADQTINLSKSTSGTWHTKQKGDLKGRFYTFRVKTNGSWSNEVPDPYAKAVGVNGKRAMVVDLKETYRRMGERKKPGFFKPANGCSDL